MRLSVRILSLSLVFSLCLIVCVLPVSASDWDIENATGAIYPDGSLFAYSRTGSSAWINVFDDNPHPAAFTLVDRSYYYQTANILMTRFKVNANDDAYIEYIFSLPSSGVVSFAPSDGYAAGVYYALMKANTDAIYKEFGEYLSIELLVDGVVVDSFSELDPIGDFSISVDQRFSFRVRSNADTIRIVMDKSSSSSFYFLTEIQLAGSFTADEPSNPDEPSDPTDPTDPSDPSGGGSGSQDLTEVIESIEVVQGHLEEINGNIVDIKDDVQDIKVQIEDTKQQLEDPTSPIWEAAGEAIGNALEGLFVPSEDDIADVKQGFDDLAEDKLGGAHTAMQIVDDTFTQVNDKLNNPSAAEGIQFPGISVPLGGDIGVVELAPAQMVTLPLELTSILHPVAGTIVSIICGLGTFNVLKDMVECFLSGFSYSEFLHRSKGGSDE